MRVCDQVHDLGFTHAGFLRTGTTSGTAVQIHAGRVQDHAGPLDEFFAFGGGVGKVFEVGGQVSADVINVIQSLDIDETKAPECGKLIVRDIGGDIREDEEHMNVPGTTALRFGGVDVLKVSQTEAGAFDKLIHITVQPFGVSHVFLVSQRNPAATLGVYGVGVDEITELFT